MIEKIKSINDKFWLPFLLASVAAVGMLVGYRLDEEYASSDETIIQDKADVFKPGKIEELIKYVDAKYVDEVDTDQLMESTMRFVLSQLDPFSSYLTPSELKRYEEQISGRFEGLGVELHFIRDTLSVFYVYPESPAERMGLSAGDRILRINDLEVSGQGLDDDDIDRLILDNSSKDIKTYMLDVNGETKEVNIQRGAFSINSVSCAYMVNDSVGYVRLRRFTTKSYKDFMTAMGNLSENYGMKHLIFDLRSNPGGVLQEAIKILQEFYTENGKLLLFTQGDNMPREEYITHGKPFHIVDKIVVLINNGSASASEVVAGALQDTDRGIIIGENSYGKGLVQEHYKLRNGGELRLTIARYYTPSGRLIQRAYRSASDFNMEKDTSDFKTSSGRTVHAGGGVTPDRLLYQPASALQILDSLDIEDGYESIFDCYLRTVRSNPDYKIEDAFNQAAQLTSDLYSVLVRDNEDRMKRLEPNQRMVENYLFSSFVQMIGGSRYAEEVVTKSESVVEAGLDYITSNKRLVSNKN